MHNASSCHVYGILGTRDVTVVLFFFSGCLILYAYSMMGKKLCSVAPPFDSNEGVSSSRQVRILPSVVNIFGVIIAI